LIVIRRVLALHVCSAAVLAYAAVLGPGAASAAADDGKIGMNAKAFLAECEKGVEFWCSNQIWTVDIDDMLQQNRTTRCMPKKGNGTSAERNAKVVAAVKGWFAQHPDEIAAEGDASGPILKALNELWPGPCQE
jgi:hypothetical protein